MFARSTHLSRRFWALPATAAVAIAVPLAGCGGSGGSSSTTIASQPATAATTTTAATGKVSCGSSVTTSASEAASTAAGDIPDNQQFLTFKSQTGGYSIKYPEGWARSGSGTNVTFQDKSNTVTITVTPGPAPTPSSVGKQLKQQAASDPCLSSGTPQTATVGPNQAVKVTYTTQGAKSPVTGQRNKVTVDRYVFSKGGRVATVDLSNPVGVDNVDAYRMISESFRWS
jgi:PsbP